MSNPNVQNFTGHTVRETGGYHTYHHGYYLEEQAGVGGFAAVYRARDLDERSPVDNTVAVKVVNQFKNSEEERAFADEGHRTTRLSHPNILSSYAYGRGQVINPQGQAVAERPIIVMPYFRGGSVEDRLRSAEGGRLPLGETVDLISQAAEGLEFAHSRRILHRDIKPQNLLLDPMQDGNTRLAVADFGIAINLHDHDEDGTFTAQVAFGTPAYIAPEQLGQRAVRQSDIYSLGVVAYRALTGRLPYMGSTDEILAGHLSNEMPPHILEVLEAAGVKRSNPIIAVAEQIMPTLARRPEDRPKSIGAVGRAMQTAYGTALRRQINTSYHDLAMQGRTVPRHVAEGAANQPGPHGTQRLPDNAGGWVGAYDQLAKQNAEAQVEIIELRERYSRLQRRVRELESLTQQHPGQAEPSAPAIPPEAAPSRTNRLSRQVAQHIGFTTFRNLLDTVASPEPLRYDEETFAAAVQSPLTGFVHFRHNDGTLYRWPAVVRSKNSADSYDLTLPPSEACLADPSIAGQVAEIVKDYRYAYIGYQGRDNLDSGKYVARALAARQPGRQVRIDTYSQTSYDLATITAAQPPNRRRVIPDVHASFMDTYRQGFAGPPLPNEPDVSLIAPQRGDRWNRQLLEEFEAIHRYRNELQDRDRRPLTPWWEVRSILHHPGTITALHRDNEGRTVSFTPLATDLTAVPNMNPAYFQQRLNGETTLYTPGTFVGDLTPEAEQGVDAAAKLIASVMIGDRVRTRLIWRTGAMVTSFLSTSHRQRVGAIETTEDFAKATHKSLSLGRPYEQ